MYRPFRIAVVCLAILITAPLHASKAPTHEELYLEAVDLLDRWRGNRAMLDEAHERLTTLLLENPKYAPGHVEMARWYLMNSWNFKPALRSLVRAEALDPKFAGTYVLRGYIYQEEDRLDEALDALDQAEAIGSDNPWLPLNRAFVYTKQGRHEEARTLLRLVFDRDVDDPKAWPAAKNALINSLARTKDAAAIEAVHLQAIDIKPDDLAQKAGHIRWMLRQGQLTRAVDYATDIDKHSANAESGGILLSTLYAQAESLWLEDSVSARKSFDAAIEVASRLGVEDLPSYEAWNQQMSLIKQAERAAREQ